MNVSCEPYLRLDGFSAGYLPGVAIVNDVTIDIAPASVTTIVGPNGAGKSSLLKGIYGLTRCSSGAVLVAGVDISKLPPWRRLTHGVALVPQGRCNFPRMTVLENLQLAAYTLPRAQRARIVNGTFERYPTLSRMRSRAAGNLSGGEQQLLEVAMAMTVEPRALLIDEPSLGLSPKTRGEVFAQLVDIAHDGVSVLMVEQNVVEGLAASDYAIVMTDGRVRRHGAAADVLTDPDMKHVFLGGRPEGTAAREAAY